MCKGYDMEYKHHAILSSPNLVLFSIKQTKNVFQYIYKKQDPNFNIKSWYVSSVKNNICISQPKKGNVEEKGTVSKKKSVTSAQ